MDYILHTIAAGVFFYAVALVVGLPVGFLVLRWLDGRLAARKGNFSVHFAKMENDPVALAHYLGLRFIGICIVIGLIAAGFAILR